MEMSIGHTNCFGSPFLDWWIAADLILMCCRVTRLFLRTLASRGLSR